MTMSPKDTNQKLEKILNSWETLTPTKSFGGMTFAQFQTGIQPSFDARARIEDLEAERTQALADRDQADEISLAKAQQAVNGVLADPTEGPDSAIYEAFGYTPKRERKSGLTRRKSTKTTETK